MQAFQPGFPHLVMCIPGSSPPLYALIAMFGIYFYTLDKSIIQNPRDGPDEHLKRSLHLVFTDSENYVIVHSIYTRQSSLTQQLIKNSISLSIRL